MIINKQNGQIEVNSGLTLHPNLDLSHFLSRTDHSNWKIADNSEIGIIYENTVFDDQSQKINVRLAFLKTMLWSIYLSFYLPEDNRERVHQEDYDYLPVGVDTKRQHFHDTILRQELGESPYQFDWGFVAVGWSNGFSCIAVTYAPGSGQ